MRINKVQDSPRAAATLRHAIYGGAIPGDRFKLATDCPERCMGDRGDEGGHCPHGWRTADETLKRWNGEAVER
jgi:hypothetical protein